MTKPNTGGFEEVMAQANQMAQGPMMSPFGMPAQALAQGPRLPIRQTTQVFYLPRDVAAYDELCNTLWAGQGRIRFEERAFTKDSEVVIVLSYFSEAEPPRPARAEPGGGAAEEAEVRPYRIAENDGAP